MLSSWGGSSTITILPKGDFLARASRRYKWRKGMSLAHSARNTWGRFDTFRELTVIKGLKSIDAMKT